MRKPVSLVITAALGLGLVGMSSPSPSWANTPEPCAESTDGPDYNGESFEISNAQELIYLSQNYQNVVKDNAAGVDGDVDDITGEWREQDFSLTASIDLAGCNFTPIGVNDDGSYSTSFAG